jgi:hypothetical protein
LVMGIMGGVGQSIQTFIYVRNKLWISNVYQMTIINNTDYYLKFDKKANFTSSHAPQPRTNDN